MAVVENGGADAGAGVISPSPPSSVVSQDSGVSSNDRDHQSRIELGLNPSGGGPVLRHDQGGIYGKIGSHVPRSDGDDGGESFKREMRELQELFSKLNPMAEEFVPPSLVRQGSDGFNGVNGGFITGFNSFLSNNVFGAPGNGSFNRGFRRKKSFGQGKRRINSRTSMAQREEIIRRTVYVSDIDQQVTEEQLAGLFVSCGQVVDCRICGDPNSVLRFAFIEFTDEEGARAALNLSGTMLGFYPVRVLPSKTAIAPVNPTFLPRTEDEREMCARTIYCTNIDKKVTQTDLKLFFESVCGEVYRLRVLGDFQHSTRIAFVEFVMAESAIAALNCSGVVLGSFPIRVSPSKTPVRPRSPRLPIH
ncbi:PREDICTED: polyadenylate-binding protein-interacting protein 11 [Tarenaya hassleriana]|uniref:polyadenylate-binding protein-interacting protein 11 n=1 Tax=Tarenaya hassleriana TaxID=28532 RepID=UPI00053C2CA9|nr:PREDICTED: polyadenylate-binding protein-interacting protein 11 [Tarenaya hassleriana]XP_010538862.1 PREDICTED: polyadenylate-binding protein-interacting protein 11 [Tarenaya hassleriana]